jgi:hypothetical protein
MKKIKNGIFAAMIAVSVYGIFGCHIQLVATSDAAIAARITAVGASADSLADNIQSSPDKDYENYMVKYQEIDVQLAEIIVSQGLRAKGGLLKTQAEKTKNIFDNWLNYHARYITITNTLVLDFKEQLDASIKAQLDSENSL